MVDAAGREVKAVSRYLRDLALGDASPATGRSYAHDLPAAVPAVVVGLPGTADGLLRFDTIPQPWLRHLVKRFLRWRISTGKSYHQINRDITALQRLADAFTAQAGPDAQPGDFTRATVETFLTLLVERGLGPASRGYDLSSVKTFLRTARQQEWVPLLAVAVRRGPWRWFYVGARVICCRLLRTVGKVTWRAMGERQGQIQRHIDTLVGTGAEAGAVGQHDPGRPSRRDPLSCPRGCAGAESATIIRRKS